ncbi:MAG: hypothetical protein PVJ39_16410 [Gammaproteobacteria bacterium]
MMCKFITHKNNVTKFVTLLVVCVSITGMKSVDDEWQQFLNDDSEARALAVNEGDLEFLSSPPDKPPHVLHNKYTIKSESLKDGWVDLTQCHGNLDKVPESQILYYARRTRNLRVISSSGIERAWVQNNSVQLRNVTGDDASVCVKAQVHSLYPNYDGTYSMRNGPYLRRFLDGYYPMRVTMDVTLPKGELRFDMITPMEQEGFSVDHDSQSMQVDALFVGELNIEVYFDGAQ